MSPTEPDANLPQPAQPWNWRKLCWCAGGALISLLCLFVANLRQPWGQPLPGISLTPRFASSLRDVKLGSFWDLVEKAAASYHVDKMNHNSFRIIDGRGISPRLGEWEQWPNAKPALLAETEIALLEKASELNLSECRVPLDFMAGKATVDTLEHLLRLLRLHTWLAIDEADPPRANHFIQVQLQLCERLKQGGNIALIKQINDWQVGAMHGLRLSAAHFPARDHIAQLRGMLTNTSSMELDLAEWLRLHLHAVEVDASQFHQDFPACDSVNSWVGFTDDRRLANVRFAYSHVLAELAAETNSERALDKLREMAGMGRGSGAKFRNHWRSDRSTRVNLFVEVDSIRQLEIPHAKYTAMEKATTLAVLALVEYRQRVGHWPDALSDAMTEVPLDPFSNYLAPIIYELAPDKANWQIHPASKRYLVARGYTPVSSAILIPATR